MNKTAASDLAAIDILALLAEVTAPGYVEPAYAVAAGAAYAASTARHAASDAREARRVGATRGDCRRCWGRGHLPQFRHISGGDCFACDGTGDTGNAR